MDLQPVDFRFQIQEILLGDTLLLAHVHPWLFVRLTASTLRFQHLPTSNCPRNWLATGTTNEQKLQRSSPRIQARLCTSSMQGIQLLGRRQPATPLTDVCSGHVARGYRSAALVCFCGLHVLLWTICANDQPHSLKARGCFSTSPKP